jgi:hypothetical protein
MSTRFDDSGASSPLQHVLPQPTHGTTARRRPHEPRDERCRRLFFSRQRLFFFGDDGALRGEFSIELLVILPFFGKVVFMEDGFHRALRNARLAVDAFFRVNVEHRFTLVKALHRAHDDAIRVFAVETRLGYDVGHYSVLSLAFRVKNPAFDCIVVVVLQSVKGPFSPISQGWESPNAIAAIALL